MRRPPPNPGSDRQRLESSIQLVRRQRDRATSGGGVWQVWDWLAGVLEREWAAGRFRRGELATVHLEVTGVAGHFERSPAGSWTRVLGGHHCGIDAPLRHTLEALAGFSSFRSIDAGEDDAAVTAAPIVGTPLHPESPR